MGKISIDGKGNSSVFVKFSSFFSPSVETKSKFVFQLVHLSVENILDYEVFAHYDVGPCRISICKDKKGKMYYLIDEPPIDDVGKALYTKIMKFLYISLPSEIGNDMSARIYLKKKVIEIAKKMKLEKHVIPILDTLLYYVARDAFGYGVIDVLMKDDNLEDILEESFNSPVGIIHKKFGEYNILDTNINFDTIDATNSFVQKLVQRTGKSMTAAVPIIDSMTKEGHRIAATFGKEISLPGPNFTIRKFSKEPLTITKLLQTGTLSPLMAAYVWTLLDSKAFVLLIGSTAAGKTTTIGAFTSLINPQMKITTIEDTPELRMGHVHWQRLITRKGSSILSDKYEITMNELVRLSLRSRPDYIVVGEVRGEEISSLIQAVATGHGGLTSFHASDASATLVRMKSPPMNVHLSGQMLISSIVQQNRLVSPDGKIVRKVTEITEIVPTDEKIELKKVMGWDASTMQFFPENVEELVKKSMRLHEVSMINGWTKEDLTSQLITRMCFLMRMMQNNITEFNDVSKELEKFYYDPLERYTSILSTKSLGEFSNEKISAKQLSSLGL